MCANEKERKTNVYHNHTCQRETRCHKNSWLPAIFFFLLLYGMKRYVMLKLKTKQILKHRLKCRRIVKEG